MHKLMIRMGAGVFAALALVAVLGILAWNGAQPVQAQQSPTAMRTFSPMPAAPGGMVTVTVSVTNIDPPWAVTETLPAGFTSALSDVDTSTAGKQIRVRSTGGASVNYDVTASSTVGSHDFMGTVTYRVGDNAPQNLMVPTNSIEVMAGGGNGGMMGTRYASSVTARPDDPGDATQITVKFTTSDFLDIGQSITLEVEDDLGVPSTIDADDVDIRGLAAVSSRADRNIRSANPQSVIVDTNDPDERYVIELVIGNMDDSADELTDLGLHEGPVTVTFRQSAGITNRTEGGNDDWFVETSAEGLLDSLPEVLKANGDVDLEEGQIATVYDVPWTIDLTSYGDSRGEEITAIGKGFKNGTTTTFWIDKDRNGMIDTGEDELCDGCRERGRHRRPANSPWVTRPSTRARRATTSTPSTAATRRPVSWTHQSMAKQSFTHSKHPN